MVRRLHPVCLLFFCTGCLATGNRPAPYVAASPVHLAPTGVVFVANGAGDYRSVTENLGQVVNETATPLQIETVAWSRGFRRYVDDQMDHDNHLAQGRRLACQVTAYRQAYPGRHVYLMGHSAGCAIVLIAAESLPSDSIDRIILLAPSVCQTYDLRPALRSARYSIDTFNSDEDRLILGLGMRLFGTAERECDAAAGEYGFTPVIVCPADSALYGKLRQHGWDPALEWAGHYGGHFGSTRPAFLRAYVLPLLCDPAHG